MPNNFQSLQSFNFTASTADDLDRAFGVAHRNAAATAATVTLDSTRFRLTETVAGTTTTYDFPWATYTTPIALARAVRRTQSTGSSTVNAPVYPFKINLQACNGDEVISTLAFITVSAASLISATYLEPGYNVLWDTSVLLFRAMCAGREYQLVDSIDVTKTLTFEEKTSKGVLQNYLLDPSYAAPNSPASNLGRSLPPSLCAWLQSLVVRGTHAGQTGIVRIYIADQDNAGVEVWTQPGLASATTYTLNATYWGEGKIVSAANQRIVITWIATSGAITVPTFSLGSTIGYFNGALN